MEIIEIIDRFDESMGILRPFLCTADNGQPYFVKGKNAGIRGLIKEWICAKLAQAYGLPIPEPEILTIDPRLVKLAKPEWHDDLSCNFLFGSKSVAPCEILTYSGISYIPELELRDLLVFDHWIMNDDRNLTVKGGNVNLLQRNAPLHKERDWFIIDHNLAFDENYRDLPSNLNFHVAYKAWQDNPIDLIDRVQYENRMGNTLTLLNTFIRDLPHEWIEWLAENDDTYMAKLQSTLDRYTQDEFWGTLM
ncbi:MAG: hypothetical protein AXW15_13535 [Neptuniibacter sp. Phe_28]|jgi:hypothetical protein|nr:MAG: hypothetical protein AXW15_13535 [Neptuniibacter sp. Phe_28]|tara:strand:+ start:2486 stop:3232 length:747 start_codon:yes stop_codon:yes gene_type:complete